MKSTVKQAVILAAGMGTRIRATGEQGPKPLVKVGGLTLLKRAILTAAKVGVEKFIIVVGYEAELVKSAITQDSELSKFEFHWAMNDQYELKNGVSVLKAKTFVDGEFFLAMSDHIVDWQIYQKLSQADMKGDLNLAVDTRLTEIFDMDDATKVKVGPNQEILGIAKDLKEYDVIDTGVFRCKPALFDVLNLCYEKNGNVSLSEAITEMSKDQKAYVVDIEKSWWQDVDDVPSKIEAEKMLFKTLTKAIDGPVSRHINRKFSKMLTKLVMNTNIVPNHMTALGLVIGILSAVVLAFASPEHWYYLPIAGILYQISSMIDGCDGEIARLKFKHSAIGEWFDTISDDVINLGYQLAMGIALYRFTNQIQWLYISIFCFVAGWIVSLNLYYQLIQSKKGTHLAINWSFEQNQESWFQRVCAKFAFVARRDFYALLLAIFSFFGVPALKLSMLLSAITISFLFAQWFKTFKTTKSLNKVDQNTVASIDRPTTGTHKLVRQH